MAATYPVGIFAPPTLTDYVDFDFADNISKAYLEIVAVEMALGPEAGSLHDSSHVANTVGSILDAHDDAITTLQSKTALSYATLLGGPATGLNVSVTPSGPSGLLLQSNNGATGRPSNMYLQNSGGDLLIGGGQTAVTVFGSLSVSSGGQIITPVLTVQKSAAISGNLSLINLIASGTVSGASVAAPTITASTGLFAASLTMTGNGSITLGGGGERLRAEGANQSIWDGSEVYSIKKVHGHLRAFGSPAWQTGGWSQAPICAVRGDSTGPGQFSDVASTVWYATYSNYGGGIAFCLVTDATATNLGWQSQNGSATAIGAFFGTAFIVASAAGLKENIRDMEPGLSTLAQLRPVTYKRKDVDYFSPAALDKKSSQMVPARGAEKQLARERHEEAVSLGDRKRGGLESHGFIAEEVEAILPEAIHYNADGTAAGIDYTAVIALQAKAITELHQKVLELESLVREHLV